MTIADQTHGLATELGLLGTHVFFNEDWVPYADRQNYLLEADIGVSTHLDHIETEFSFRTRILDYFWAGLPVVCTAGDSLADLIEGSGAGLTVPPADVDRLEEALFRLLDDADLGAQAGLASRGLADELRWSDDAASPRRVLPCPAPRPRPRRPADGVEHRRPAQRPATAPPPAARLRDRHGSHPAGRLARTRHPREASAPDGSSRSDDPPRLTRGASDPRRGLCDQSGTETARVACAPMSDAPLDAAEELLKTRDELVATQAQLGDALGQLRVLEAELARYQQAANELDALKHSLTWRLLAPYRALRRVGPGRDRARPSA